MVDTAHRPRLGALLALALAALSVCGCFDDPSSGAHPCDECLPCESCVDGPDGPTCAAASHQSQACIGSAIHWLDSCGADEGVAEVCPEHATCESEGDGAPACVCTNHWEGDDCDVCPANWDPYQDCAACEGNYDLATDCAACLQNWSAASGCTACEGNWDVEDACLVCENHWMDEGNDCGTCPDNWDPEADCDECLNHWVDEDNDCGTCPANWDASEECDACQTNWEGDDCDLCPGNWNPLDNCATCWNHWIDEDNDCGTCPGNWNAAEDCVACETHWEGTDCETCPGNWNPLANCASCENHWIDEDNDCGTCPGNWDAAAACNACETNWTGTNCATCPGNWDATANCAVCENHWVDDDDDCGTCPGNWDAAADCDACETNWDGTDCETCPGNWNPLANCAACENHWIDEGNDCGTCPGNWDAAADCNACQNHWTGTSCTTCPGNWDATADCAVCETHWEGVDCETCPGNWNPLANCAVCENHWIDEGNDCGTCPGNWDPAAACDACIGNWDELADCAVCANHWVDESNDCGTCPGNWDPAAACDACIGNWDELADCAACANHWVDEGNDCGTCPPEFLPEDDCMAQVCGNEHVETGEECDDGNAVDWDGCNDCAIAEFLIAAVAGSQGVAPTCGLADDGSLAATWTLYTPEPTVEADVIARRVGADGSMAEPAFLVNTYTNDWQGDAVIAMAGDGRFAISWYSWGQDGSGGGVFGQRFDADGTPQGSEFQVNTTEPGDQFFSAVAMQITGGFTVVWRGPDAMYSSDVFGQRFDAAGLPLGVEFVVNEYLTDYQDMPALAMNGETGASVAVWASHMQDGDSWGVFGRSFDAEGAAVGGEIQVNTFETFGQYMPSVAMRDDGSWAVVWVSEGEVDDGWGAPHVFGRLFDAEGVAITGEILISTTIDVLQGSPKVAATADNEFVVVWQAVNMEGTDSDIVGQRLDEVLDKIGGEFEIGALTSGLQEAPAVVSNAAGQFVVVWSSEMPDGSGDTGIYAQRYAAAGTPMGVLPW